MELWQLRQRQALPLEVKVQMSLLRIREFYEYCEGNVYVAFSGGKDSVVLLDLVRSLYPKTEAVFCNTGLEFPEIVKFCKDTENCTIIRPEKKFKQVIEEYGYPVVSKEQALYIRQYRHTNSQKLRNVRWNGKQYGAMTKGKIFDKWKYLVDAPFEISERCCHWLKKRPSLNFNRMSGKFPFLGLRADDSILRQRLYLTSGCNVMDGKMSQGRPLAIWNDENIWGYIEQKNLGYCTIYNQGYDRTGCLFCGFGVHLEEQPNRFQRLQQTHPKLWEYCMDKLGMREVLEYMGIPYMGFQMTLPGFEDNARRD